MIEIVPEKIGQLPVVFFSNRKIHYFDFIRKFVFAVLRVRPVDKRFDFLFREK